MVNNYLAINNQIKWLYVNTGIVVNTKWSLEENDLN